MQRVTPIILNKPNEWVKVDFDPERPYVCLTNIRISDPDIDVSSLSDDYSFKFKYKISYTHSNTEEKYKHLPDNPHKGFNIKLPAYQAKSLELKYELRSGLADQVIQDWIIEVDYTSMEMFDIQLPEKEFELHLQDSKNVKILFSAPFGQGKTTFLNDFFEKRKDKYRVFKISPVNYSVASNKDIFRYIKAELLFQLIVYHAPHFEKVAIDKSLTAAQFVKDKALKLFKPFISLLPDLGDDNIDYKLVMNAMISVWGTLKSNYDDFHEKMQTDELKAAGKYFKEFMEEEGGIFEDDFYTQLIRGLLAKIRLEDPLENVFLIDDLDRIDPEHIFRILNVLSAHYDQEQKLLGYGSNKFGFDRIILVGDYGNLESIYAHKFGVNTDFTGYMNKFFSQGVFRYSNKEVSYKLLQGIDEYADGSTDKYEFHEFYHLAEALVNANLLTLREVLKLKALTLANTANDLRAKTNILQVNMKHSIFLPAVVLLSKIGSGRQLCAKIEQLERSHFPRDIDLYTKCLLLIAALEKGDMKNITTVYKGIKMNYAVNSSSYDGVNVANEEFIDKSNSELGELKYKVFEFSDFKELLIRNIKELEKLT